jgi:hypothetical protein
MVQVVGEAAEQDGLGAMLHDRPTQRKRARRAVTQSLGLSSREPAAAEQEIRTNAPFGPKYRSLDQWLAVAMRE